MIVEIYLVAELDYKEVKSSLFPHPSPRKGIYGEGFLLSLRKKERGKFVLILKVNPQPPTPVARREQHTVKFIGRGIGRKRKLCSLGDKPAYKTVYLLSKVFSICQSKRTP
jgi:hypothetical protein